MKKGKIILIFILSILFSVVVVFSASAYFLLVHHYKGTQINNPWRVEDEFKLQNIATVQKQKDKDFVILNLADVQMCDLEDFFNRKIIYKEISYLIEQTKPNLITLTGDQTWSNENLISLKSLIGWLDSFKIPYAPVFGNHDYGNTKNSAVAELNYCCELYEKGKYCLFNRGPSNLGTLVNYVINIMEENKIYKTLYMLDAGYEDVITTQQIEWFKWNAEGIKQANGGEYTSAMCFMHKPLPEYSVAYNKYRSGSAEAEAINDVHVHYSLSGTMQNGFFDAAKERGVLDVVCGHQHGNNFTIKYNGVRLTFATKTGELGGFYDDGIVNLNGATSFVLNDDGVNINNIYVDRKQFFINNNNNSFNW